jgi:Quinohemoprotein amine dehydrogenase A, alpha subunit, haem binding
MHMSKLAVIVSGSAFALLMTRAVVSEAQTVAPASPATTATAAPPPGPGLDLINQRCVFCHTAAQVFAARKTPAEWAATVQRMADRGAELSPDEQQIVVAYLAKNFPSAGSSSSPAANRPGAGAAPAAGTKPAPKSSGPAGQHG